MDDPLAGRLLHGPGLRWPGASSRGSVVVPLRHEHFSHLAPRLTLVGQPLHLKQEFHLTLFNADEWRAVRAVRAEASVAALATALDWSVRSEAGYWLVQRPDDKAWRTLIATLDAPALTRLRKMLSSSDCHLSPPAPHVTLYCSDQRGGIGISGARQWEERVVAGVEIDWDAQCGSLAPSGA
jgi:hypothetical protein